VYIVQDHNEERTINILSTKTRLWRV